MRVGGRVCLVCSVAGSFASGVLGFFFPLFFRLLFSPEWKTNKKVDHIYFTYKSHSKE